MRAPIGRRCGGKLRARALGRGLVAAVTTAVLWAASLAYAPLVQAAPPPLTAQQVVDLARQAAADATGPGASTGGGGSHTLRPSEPAFHGGGDVAAGAGGVVDVASVEVAFSASLASSVHVAVDSLARDPLGSPRVGGDGLPAGAVEVGAAFEVSATDGAGAGVTSFPTTYDVVHDDATDIDRAVNVVPGVRLSVDVAAADLAGLNPATVRLYSRESDAERWRLVPSHLDAVAGVVHGELDHLSQFVVIGIPVPAGSGPDGGAGSG